MKWIKLQKILKWNEKWERKTEFTRKNIFKKIKWTKGEKEVSVELPDEIYDMEIKKTVFNHIKIIILIESGLVQKSAKNIYIKQIKHKLSWHEYEQ